jgi:hypothetical protein
VAQEAQPRLAICRDDKTQGSFFNAQMRWQICPDAVRQANFVVCDVPIKGLRLKWPGCNNDLAVEFGLQQFSVF